MQLKRSKRPVWEYTVVVGIVGFTMGMTAALYGKRDQVFKERLLILELQTLRNHSAAYILENKKFPSYTGLQSDPFGYSYTFHSSSGWIATTHPRYQHW